MIISFKLVLIADYLQLQNVDGVLSASCSKNLTIVGVVCSVVFYLIGLLSAVLGFIIYSKICQQKPPGLFIQRDNEEDILSPSAPRRGTDVQLEDRAVMSASDPTRETTLSQLPNPTDGHKDDDQLYDDVAGKASGDEDIVLKENTVYDICN